MEVLVHLLIAEYWQYLLIREVYVGVLIKDRLCLGVYLNKDAVRGFYRYNFYFPIMYVVL